MHPNTVQRAARADKLVVAAEDALLDSYVVYLGRDCQIDSPEGAFDVSSLHLA
jgi:hypothetical protein